MLITNEAIIECDATKVIDINKRTPKMELINRLFSMSVCSAYRIS